MHGHIRVEGVCKRFCSNLKRSLWYGAQDIWRDLIGKGTRAGRLRKGEFWALNDVSFELGPGESLGLIGHNGAGKSTLLKLLNGLIKPDRGAIRIRGRVGALIELGVGFNPVLTGRENVFVNAAVLGISKREVRRLLDAIIAFADVEPFIDMPVQSYSSGMRVRLGFAVAAHLSPDVLLVDEVLAVGDAAFQRRCLQHMKRYVDGGGTMVLVSHNMHLVQSMCTHGLLLQEGAVASLGPCTEAVDAYHRAQLLRQVRGGEDEARRKGPGTIVIEAVDVQPVGGGDLRTDAAARVVLRYRSPEEVPGVTWGFSIWTGDQWVRITTCTARLSGKVHTLNRGEGVFTCTIPQFPLVGGTYALKAGIYDVEATWPLARKGWEDAAVAFTVLPGGREGDNRRVIDGDLVKMDVEWD